MTNDNKMPVIFFGHGNPMNALMENEYTRAWAEIGRSFPRPRAIVCISAHWYVPFTGVTAMESPRTIHDFGGFPLELYRVSYPAPGDRDLARRIQALLAPVSVQLDQEWGLDHGTWSVLCHVFPEADVPVVQISIDETQPPAFHFEVSKRLAVLRDENVLIIGSGNVVHNLHAYAWGRHSVQAYDWAVRFEGEVRKMISARNFTPLVDYELLGRDAVLSVPTPDHYLPMLYAISLAQEEEEITFPVSGFDGGSVSMLAVRIG
jgi:4,5-DOPA dioxygenase extradiol